MKRIVCEVKREEHIPMSNLQVTEKAIWLNLAVWMKKQVRATIDGFAVIFHVNLALRTVGNY